MVRQSLIAFSLMIGAAAHAQSALDYPSTWTCDSNKFNWYCDQEDAATKPAAMPAPVRSQEPAKSPAPRRIEIKDIKTAEQMRVELKRREDIAVMSPTEKNLRDYLELWQIVQDKGIGLCGQLAAGGVAKPRS
jgi:conjugal transfer pilus assembly protein TraF